MWNLLIEKIPKVPAKLINLSFLMLKNVKRKILLQDPSCLQRVMMSSEQLLIKMLQETKSLGDKDI